MDRFFVIFPLLISCLGGNGLQEAEDVATRYSEKYSDESRMNVSQTSDRSNASQHFNSLVPPNIDENVNHDQRMLGKPPLTIQPSRKRRFTSQSDDNDSEYFPDGNSPTEALEKSWQLILFSFFRRHS